MRPDTSIQHFQNSEILIVDDSESTQIQLEKILTQAGYKVRVVRSASLALDSIKAKKPSLILLDVRMPDLNGYELCRRIKADERTSEIPIIFISASVQKKEIPTGFEMGAVDFILKPFRDTEVLARVATHLTLYHMRQELKLKNEQLMAEASERSKQEQEIKESEYRFSDIFQTMNDGLVYLSPTGTVLKVNEALVRITGTPEKKLINMSAMDVVRTFLPLHEITRILPMTINILKGLPLVPFELKYKDKILEIRAQQSANSRNLICIIRDITKQKKVEEDVRKEQLYFDQLIETAPEGIAIVDPESKIIRINKEFVRMFGYSSEELIRHYIDDLILPEEYREESKKLKAGITDGTGIVVETQRRKKDGSLLDVSIMGAPINLGGKHVAVYAIYRDISQRKQAAKALKDSEEKFRSVFELSPLGKSLTEVDGTVHVNSAFADMLGYTMKELESKNWREITHPEDIQKSADLVKSFLNGKSKRMSIEKRYIHKNGNIVWTNVTTSLLRNADGTPRFFITSLENITERKQMYDALRESNEYLDSLITSANAPIIVWDSQLKITRFNHAFENLTGNKAGTVVGKDIGLLFPEAKKEECLHYIRQSNQGERCDTVEIPVIGKDGVVHIVLWSSATIYGSDEKTVIATIAQCQDITSRVLAEDVIQKNESLMKRLVDILQHPSETIQEFLDYALEQAIQLSQSKIGYIYHYSEDRKVFVLNTWSKDVMQECSVSHPLVTYELDKTGIWGEAVRQRRPIVINDFPAANPLKKGTPEGHVQLLKFMTVPIFRDKKIVGVVGLANKETDYTETDILQTSLLLESVWKVVDRKKAEEELRTLNSTLDQQIQKRTNELQVTNKELEAFSYSVSHDLRAPLRSIEGFSKIFLEEYGAGIPEKGHHYLERVRSNAVRMGELIDSLLKLSQVSRSTLSLKMIDLSAIADQVIKETANENPRKKVNVQIEPGMMAMADPQLIRIVLMNLISNAWKFTSKRECAHISVGKVIDPQYGPAFFVRDDGAGFDNNSADKLFSAFQRLHTEKEFVGTGIGLATIARIIHRHGGEVWAEGEVDKGATFYFSIPDLRDHHKLE